MNEKSLVSVLISYYNDEKHLRQSIESVLNSTYTNFELFLVNHATLDDCREIAHSYNDPRIVHMDMPYNITVGGTGWIVGEFLKKAKGKYIKLFCADDVLCKNGLELLVDYMENHPEKDFAFGNMNYVDENGKNLNANHFDDREGFSRDLDEVKAIRLYADGLSVFPYPSSIIRTEALKKIKLNKSIAMTFDMSLWLSLLCKGCKFGLLNQRIVNYRVSDNQACALNKEDKAKMLSYFEWASFWKIFQSIDDIMLLKKVWSQDKLIEKMTSKKDIPFCVAVHFFHPKTIPPIRNVAYEYIADLLNDDEKRQYLEEKFGYTLRNLRLGCLGIFEETEKTKEAEKKKLSTPEKDPSFLKRFKIKIFQKTAKQLNILELIFLFVRKCIHSLNPVKSYRDKQKRKKQFNL